MQRGGGGSEEANQMRHLSNWHATWRSNMQTAGRNCRGWAWHGAKTCSLLHAWQISDEISIHSSQTRPLKERQSFLYKMFGATCNSLCCKFNLIFYIFSVAFFWHEVASRQLAEEDSAGKGCASFAGLCMRRSRLGDLCSSCGMWRSEHASHS